MYNFGTTVDSSIYAAEQRILHGFEESKCRTFDPLEADFFFVPVMVSYAAHIELGRASGRGAELQRAFDLLSKSFDYVSDPRINPFYNRRGGTDHFWVISQDIGACLAPLKFFRKVNNIVSPKKARGPFFLQTNGDRYHDPLAVLDYVTRSTTILSSAFKARLLDPRWPCYRPGEDVVIPPHFVESASVAAHHLGDKRGKRPIFIHFRGTVRDEPLYYSRGVRQWLRDNLAPSVTSFGTNVMWGGAVMVAFNLLVGANATASYWAELQMSTFCLCPPGWVGWSPRFYQAMLAGCIPVLLEVNGTVDLPFSNSQDLSNFTVAVPTRDLSSLGQILQGIPFNRVVEMRFSLEHAWHDFAYMTSDLLVGAKPHQYCSKLRNGIASIFRELQAKKETRDRK
jgi:hypothetical protein